MIVGCGEQAGGGGEGSFIHSDTETSWIGVHRYFNWTLSLSARRASGSGRREMCQLALRRCQPPTISISPSSSPSPCLPCGGALPLLTPPLLLLPFYLLFLLLLLLFLFLPRVLLLFLLLFLPLLPATQTWFVRLIPQILSDTRTHALASPACLCFPRVVSSPVNSTYEDFSHSSAAPLSVACHSRLHTAGYI